MKRRTCLPVLFLAALVATSCAAADGKAEAKAEKKAATAPKSSVSSPLAARFKLVRERIDALYRHRNEAPPPPDAATNPFRLPGTVPVLASGDGRTPTAAESLAAGLAPTSNLALLQQGAETLKISGIFEISGQLLLVINARPYRQGDLVQTVVQGEKVPLRIREIARRSVILEYKDAELTLKF